MNESTITTLLFDMDGTLIDSNPVIIEAWQRVAHRYLGRKLTDDEIKHDVVGVSANHTLKMLFSQFNNAECEEIHNQVDAYEETAPTTLIEGADNFLHQLHLFGLNLGLVTSSWHGKIDQVLKQHNINVFSKIICRTDMRQGKPHPEGYLMALQHFNIKPQQALAFEDSEGGLKAVVAAQIKPVKVSIGVKAHNDAILTIGSYHQFSFEKGRPVATLQGSRAMQLYLV